MAGASIAVAPRHALVATYVANPQAHWLTTCFFGCAHINQNCVVHFVRRCVDLNSGCCARSRHTCSHWEPRQHPTVCSSSVFWPHPYTRRHSRIFPLHTRRRRRRRHICTWDGTYRGHSLKIQGFPPQLPMIHVFWSKNGFVCCIYRPTFARGAGDRVGVLVEPELRSEPSNPLYR